MNMHKTIGAGIILLLGAAFGALAQDKPTDPQIAHIAYTAGMIDIEAATLALSQSSNEAVTSFAQSMLDDHKAVNEQAAALLEKLGVTPEDNATSRMLVSAAEEKRAKLAELKGDAFDSGLLPVSWTPR